MGKFSLLIIGLLFSFSVWSQQKTIRGRVADTKGVPLSGVTVSVQGTDNATQTNGNGEFFIAASQGNTLVFSSVGYTLQEAKIGSSDNLNISLQGQNEQLTEVVVTALGQTRSKERLGYSSSSFKADDIIRTAPVSPLDGLQGRVAGADISTIGGQPGASSKIILRGYTSLSTAGNNQALIIVDGVPFNNSRIGSFNDFLNSGGTDFGNGLNDLNPNDIESINILKGAAATNLYGSSASNGVVIVTTKRGRSGKLSVDFSSSAIFSSVAKLPDFQNTWGQGWNFEHWKEENGSWGPKMDGKERAWGSVVDNSRLLKPFRAAEDNVRDFYDQGSELTNTISLRGGNDNANFYFSYGNVNNNGILPGDVDVYKRNTLSLRGQMRADKFLASASLNYINKNGRTANTNEDAAGSSTFSNIIQTARDIKITDLKDYKNKFFNVDNYFTPYASNPYYSLFENGNTNQNDRVFGNVELGYDFSKAFNVRWKTGVDVADARVKDWQALESPNPNTWRGDPSSNDQATGLDPFILGGVRELSDYVREINSDFFVNYNSDLIKNLNLSGFIGGNYNDRESRSHESRITGLTIPGYYNITNSSNDPTTTSVTFKRRLIGAFAQANFAYSDYLFVSVNARNDWSSTLPQGKNSYFYPGVNASLVLSKLTDLSRTPISFLKLRGAFGKTGKDAPVYSLKSVGVAANSALGFGNIIFPLNGVTASEVGNVIGNTSLKPELTTEYEGGVEVQFFNNRIGIDATYYNKRTKGQILNVPIAASTGYTSLIANFGLMENKGVELVLTGAPVRSKNFNWNLTYTFTKNNNKVLELPAGLDKVDFNSYFDISMVARVGQPVGVIEAPKKVMTEDGRYVVKTTGFFEESLEDEIYGTVQRDYMMGLNNSFSYKNWGLGFSLDYRKGGVFVSSTADLTYFTGNAWLTAYNDRRPFIIPNSVLPSLDANGNQVMDANGKPVYTENTTLITPENFDNYWYHNANLVHSWEQIILPKDFLKLRDVTLSYRLPANWAHGIRAQNVSLSAIARNFLLWVPQKNTFIDPEVTNLGNDFIGEFGEQGSSPTTKAYGVSLRITF